MPHVAVELGLLAVALVVGFHFGPRLATISSMPQITLFLFIGAFMRITGAVGDDALNKVHPLHNSALACITFAAGSELELEALRSNARIIACLATAISIAALLFCFAATYVFLPAYWLQQTAVGVATVEVVERRKIVACMLSAVVAIARSPSSAIAVVAELQAAGPFTQTMLSVTMITDVVVIVLFTAASELGRELLSVEDAVGADNDATAAASSVSFGLFAGRAFAFLFHTLADFVLSLVHGGVLAGLCLGLLRLPGLPGVRHGALLLVGAWAFAAEPLLHATIHGSSLIDSLRLEPMLACIIAGFLVCNVAGRRRQFSGLLRRGMPPILCFFFTTTGADMHGEALRHAWACALGLFGARLLSLYVGTRLGCVWAGSSGPMRRIGWLGFITQAGVGLGLAEEISSKFPDWGPALRSTLVSVIVLNQVVGPPLLKHALRFAREDGASLGLSHGLLAEGSAVGEVRDAKLDARIVEKLAERNPFPKMTPNLRAAAAAAANALGLEKLAAKEKVTPNAKV